MWGNNWMMNGMWGNGKVWWFLGPLALLDLVLKGFALWKAAQKKQQLWFIAILVINSLGILPGIYLLMNNDREKSSKRSKKK